ncbi:hypothetical protein HpBGD52_11380 [Helicobacter pylori]|uniref:hypothetical protein n=1 Tax=Helicobacter pylori TaxID=210 RepID=UPI00359637D6
MLNQDVLLNSHEAGVGALWLEFLNGSISFVKSIYECQKKGKDHKEALKRTIKTTLENGVHSYGIASGGSLLGGMMHNNANKAIQSLSKGSMPAMVVVVGVKSCRILIKYFRGKIDETELLKQLGKANTSLFSGGAMAVVGQALIPIPGVGALIGGFVGAVLSETCFNALLKAREEAKLARQRRIETEKECREIMRLSDC